jgi:Cyclic nucleotide-binding domain
VGAKVTSIVAPESRRADESAGFLRDDDVMRFESSITSVSWIPSEAIEGLTRTPFDLGVGHYDNPPPEALRSLDELHAAGAFRFANRLTASVDVVDGAIVAHDQEGRSYLSRTLMGLGRAQIAFQPVAFPDLEPEPEVTATSVRFRRTAGGRPGVPAPRRVRGKPFLQWRGPTVWTTLTLTINADGTSAGELVGASTFPRHWVYDDGGVLVAKSGLIDFDEWYRGAFGSHSPWGDEDSPAVMAMAESSLERGMSSTIMRQGRRPALVEVAAGELLVEQGEPGTDLYLLLDGIIAVEVDGRVVAEVGPGAVVGERALLEQGVRTSTLRAVTDCRLARANGDDLDQAALAERAAGHHREHD